MAKDNFGNAKTREQIETSKRHSNVGGEVAEGKLFSHMSFSGKRHTARYFRLNGALACSTCKTPLE